MNNPQVAEINILLKSYNDIFSAFDPGDYSARTLSDDFISQVKNFFKSKTGNKMSLKLVLTDSERNKQDEAVIATRLQSYFKEVYFQVANEEMKLKRKGIILTVLGIFLMLSASYLSFMQPEKYHVHFLIVLFEPAGWFLLWAGLDYLVYQLKIIKSEISFFTY